MKQCNKCGRFIGKEHTCPEINPFKDKHHSKSTKEKIKNSYYHTHLKGNKIDVKKGLTYEEFYGEVRAKEIIYKMNKTKNRKGNKYENIFGLKKTKEIKKKQSDKRKKWFKNLKKDKEKYKIFLKKTSECQMGKVISIESRIKSSNTHKEKFKDKKYARRIIKSALKGLSKRPTSLEKKINDLCRIYNLPFIYTGNGTFLIGNKSPDFINKDKKIAIEVYHRYFKEKVFGSCENYEKERIKYFNNYGWKIIFIRNEEVLNKDWKNICLNKINEVLLTNI